MTEKKDLKDFVVAFELSSSKITGIAGRKNSDGSITVLAYARESSSSFMKRGMVYNIDKTAQCLSSIKQKLENSLKATIGKAYIGIGGQSLHSVRNYVSQPLAPETIISKDLVEELLNTDLSISYPDQEILDVIPQEYKLDSNYQLDPIGIMSDSIEGHYLNIIAKTALRNNIEKCLNLANMQIAGYFISPIALADCVLTDAEKRSGCVLVDFGAGTTTVVIYKNNVLRHLAVIPLGGYNISKDISGQQIEEEDAEELKLKYGCAYNENEENEDMEKSYPVTTEQEIKVHLLNDIVESRIEEILANVVEQIRQSNCMNELMAGMIITGGASNLKNMEMAISKRTDMEKIRIAKFVQQTVIAKNPDINSKDGSLNTTLALLIKGKENCFGNLIEPMEGLFGPDGESLADRIAAEKRKQEEAEQERIQKEKEEQEKQEQLKAKAEANRIKRENSFWGKLKKTVKHFGEDILNEEN